MAMTRETGKLLCAQAGSGQTLAVIKILIVSLDSSFQV